MKTIKKNSDEENYILCRLIAATKIVSKQKK